MVTPRPGSGERHQIAVLVTNTKYFEVGSSLGWVGGCGMRSWRRMARGGGGSGRCGPDPRGGHGGGRRAGGQGGRRSARSAPPGSTGSDRSRTGRPSAWSSASPACSSLGWRPGWVAHCHARLAGAGLGGGDGDPPCATRAERRQRALARPRRRLPLASKVLFAVVAVASLVEVAAFRRELPGLRSLLRLDRQRTVDGDKIGINAPTTGVVMTG